MNLDIEIGYKALEPGEHYILSLWKKDCETGEYAREPITSICNCSLADYSITDDGKVDFYYVEEPKKTETIEFVSKPYRNESGKEEIHFQIERADEVGEAYSLYSSIEDIPFVEVDFKELKEFDSIEVSFEGSIPKKIQAKLYRSEGVADTYEITNLQKNNVFSCGDEPFEKAVISVVEGSPNSNVSIGRIAFSNNKKTTISATYISANREAATEDSLIESEQEETTSENRFESQVAEDETDETRVEETISENDDLSNNDLSSNDSFVSDASDIQTIEGDSQSSGEGSSETETELNGDTEISNDNLPDAANEDATAQDTDISENDASFNDVSSDDISDNDVSDNNISIDENEAFTEDFSILMSDYAFSDKALLTETFETEEIISKVIDNNTYYCYDRSNKNLLALNEDGIITKYVYGNGLICSYSFSATEKETEEQVGEDTNKYVKPKQDYSILTTDDYMHMSFCYNPNNSNSSDNFWRSILLKNGDVQYLFDMEVMLNPTWINNCGTWTTYLGSWKDNWNKSESDYTISFSNNDFHLMCEDNPDKVYKFKIHFKYLFHKDGTFQNFYSVEVVNPENDSRILFSDLGGATYSKQGAGVDGIDLSFTLGYDGNYPYESKLLEKGPILGFDTDTYYPSFQIGGIRPETPENGAIYLGTNAGFGEACSQYVDGEWNEIVACVFLSDTWNLCETFNFSALTAGDPEKLDSEGIVLCNDSADTPIESVRLISLGGDHFPDTGKNSTVSYYSYDIRGSVTRVSDGHGNTTTEYLYSTYGQRTVTAGEGNSPLGYCARDGVLTEQTGLLYMRARYYSPELMRFINEDIIVGDISNSNSLNRYAYVEGNPVTMVDPFGLCAEKVKDFVTSLFAGVEYEVSKIYYDTLAGKLTDMLAAIGLSIKNDSNYFLTLYGMSDFNEQYRQETIVDKAVYQVPFNYGRLLTDFAALALSLKGLSLSESGIAFSVVGTGGSGGTASAITVPVGVVSVAGYVASVDVGIAAILNFISFFKEGVSVGGPKNDPSEGGLNSANTLTDAQKSRLNALNNTINDHLTESDFSGTLRDLQGNPVPNGKGGFFDHMGEMKDSYNALNKIKNGLEGSLKNPNLSNIDRQILQDGLNQANSYLIRIEELFAPYGGIK